MSYRDQLDQLGAETARQVTELWQLVPDELDAETFDELAAVIIATAAAQGAVLAELSLTVELAAQTGVAVSPAAVQLPAHPVDTGRLARAVATARESPETAPVRLGRLARAEPVESSQRAYSRAIARHPGVGGWRRGTNPDACELCTWWHRDGRLWPKSHQMPTHTGCLCEPVAVATGYARPVQR